MPITAGASRVASGLLCLHAIAIIPAGPMELVRSSISIVSGLPCEKVRSAPAIVVSGPAQRSLTLWPARSRNRLATLFIESSDSFVASAAVSIATGWSEPVPGREFHPLKSSAFSRRTFSSTNRVRGRRNREPFLLGDRIHLRRIVPRRCVNVLLDELVHSWRVRDCLGNINEVLRRDEPPFLNRPGVRRRDYQLLFSERSGRTHTGRHRICGLDWNRRNRNRFDRHFTVQRISALAATG